MEINKEMIFVKINKKHRGFVYSCLADVFISVLLPEKIVNEVVEE